MDQMVRNDIACYCIPIVRIAFWYAHISFQFAFFDDFYCVFTQIRCLSRVLEMVHCAQKQMSKHMDKKLLTFYLYQDRTLVKGAYQKNMFLISQPNIYCGYSKEQSH